MGRADILTKNYVKNKRVLADAFNYYMYDGKKFIDPNKLYEVDTTEVAVPYGEDESGISVQPVQKMRDAVYSVMTDNNAVYMKTSPKVIMQCLLKTCFMMQWNMRHRFKKRQEVIGKQKTMAAVPSSYPAFIRTIDYCRL